MAKDTHAINLLPGNNQSLLTQFLTWALTVGRLLIILTETVALATFLYRFGLDRQLIDLHDQIKQEEFIVQHFKDYEDLYRSLQQRLALAKQYDDQSGMDPQVFREIIDMGRGSVTFKTLLVSNEAVKIEVQARSVNALSDFVNALKQSPDIAAVSVDKVENKTSNAMISVAVSASLKNAPLPIPSGPTTQTALQNVNGQGVDTSGGGQ
jgi:hypothetical protein